ncbi:uncharacterized protein LOC113272180 [Papaver somniferum]|uniref:uncharacterized protein LOC113272180 n=1 Tax=Papaver somniferum TaxID=3469 RepID=UPI000E6FAB6E|nr:uncharacterized protein LOC113272180 [Papaver somniferum]
MGIWHDSKEEIESTLLQHFSSISGTTNPVTDANILFQFQTCVTDEDNEALLCIPSEQEIKDAVFQIKPWASPGADGFQASFYQQCWSTVSKELGFHQDWVKLVQQCVTTTSIALLINGSPSASFTPSRGIRQGDLLSPYLFLIIMEGFSRIIQSQILQGNLNGIIVGKHGLQVSHLFFADECLLFLEASPKYLHNLQQILDQFSKASGQVVNLQISTIFFSKNVPPSLRNQFTNILHIKIMGLGEKYLGIPLLLHRSRKKNCWPILEHMSARLQGWSSKIINQAGKTTQLNSVLITMSMYHMKVLKLPDTTIHHMEQLHRNYWWNSSSNHRKKHFISWEKMNFPKRLGGLGLKQLRHYNSAMLAKLSWNIIHSPDDHYVQLLKSKYFPYHDIKCEPPPNIKNSSWIWQSIVHGLQIVHHFGKCGSLSSLTQTQNNGMSASYISYLHPSRCKVVFQHETVNPNFILHPLFNYLAGISHTSHTFHTSHNTNSVDHSHWTSPPPDMLKTNVDASFYKAYYLAGIAMLTRNSTRSYVAGKGVLRRVATVHQAESWSLLEATQWAEQQQWKNVIFEFDCKNLVNTVNMGIHPPWQSSPLLYKCVQLCNKYNNWSCRYVSRVCNKTTDCLAKFFRKYCSTGELWQVPPATLNVNLAYDVSFL